MDMHPAAQESTGTEAAVVQAEVYVAAVGTGVERTVLAAVRIGRSSVVAWGYSCNRLVANAGAARQPSLL